LPHYLACVVGFVRNCVYLDGVIDWYVIAVISKVLEGNHVVESRQLTVAPYYECLGPVQPGSGTQPCWMLPPVTVNFDPRVVQFVVQTDAVRSRIEASLKDLSPGCTVTWPNSTASDAPGLVEISFAGSSNGVSSMTISKTCKERLIELLGAMEASNVDVLQDMWPQFVEQWEKQFPEVDKSVIVQLDRHKCCVHVVGERQKCRETTEKLESLQSGLLEEIQRSKRRISQRVPDISPHQLSLLRICGFLQTESPESLTVHIVDNVPVLEGQPDRVMDWKMKMYQLLASACSETVRVDDYVLDVLKREPFRQHLDQLLQRVTGVIWYTAGKKIELYGENQDKVSLAI